LFVVTVPNNLARRNVVLICLGGHHTRRGDRARPARRDPLRPGRPARILGRRQKLMAASAEDVVGGDFAYGTAARNDPEHSEKNISRANSARARDTGSLMIYHHRADAEFCRLAMARRERTEEPAAPSSRPPLRPGLGAISGPGLFTARASLTLDRSILEECPATRAANGKGSVFDGRCLLCTLRDTSLRLWLHSLSS